MSNAVDNIGYTLEEVFKDSYVVPLYQRGFTWKDTEIEQLLQDVYESYEENKSNPAGKYFIGSLVVLKRHNGMYEVVDGQQRLTVLSLISRILRFNSQLRLSYDTRPEVERFLSDFYDKYKLGNYKYDNESSSLVKNLENAVGYIENTNLDAKDENSKKTILYLSEKSPEELTDFVRYFRTNVILVRVILPEDTDVASYFEIMNNRGEQLQKHEIIKALLMKKIPSTDGRKTFAKIWDACAQMDMPIQKLFLPEDKKLYFGKEYNSFYIDKVAIGKGTQNPLQEKTIDDIIKSGLMDKVSKENKGDEEEEGCDLRSIIDFPNLCRQNDFHTRFHRIRLFEADGSRHPARLRRLRRHRQLCRRPPPELSHRRRLPFAARRHRAGPLPPDRPWADVVLHDHRRHDRGRPLRRRHQHAHAEEPHAAGHRPQRHLDARRGRRHLLHRHHARLFGGSHKLPVRKHPTGFGGRSCRHGGYDCHYRYYRHSFPQPFPCVVLQ